jgi:hypothetical protein
VLKKMTWILRDLFVWISFVHSFDSEENFKEFFSWQSGILCIKIFLCYL